MADSLAAMVQGFTGSGFAVSLLDDEGKTYTLMPHAPKGRHGMRNGMGMGSGMGSGMANGMGSGVDRGMGTGMPPAQRCDSSSQATDGRYASIYKVQHCKITPTSPPVQLTEFPPQRAELCPGHGNFEVGGLGSGETGFSPNRTNCYRGAAMCWTDRGSVCSPRPSRDPDAFASSLRKYPPSPDRSSEMVERLITYSQGKNYTRSCHRQHSPVSRYADAPAPYDRTSRTSRHSEYEPEAIRRHRSPEEYPTRERRGYDGECYRKQSYCKTNDIRYVRDLSRRLKETIKSMSSYFANTVNMQIQAAAEMVSQRVETVPIPVPDTRTVAVPLTPSSSDATPLFPQPKESLVSRSVQTLDTVINRRSVQTTTSTIELPVEKIKIPTRKSKSFSEFSVDKDLKDEILEWLEDTSDPKVKKIQESVIKKIGNKVKKFSGFSSERFNFKTYCHRCQRDNKAMKQHIANELHKIHLYCCSSCNSSEVLKVESNPQKVIDQNDFEEIVKDWINGICIKKRDFLQRPVKKDQIYTTIVHRLKNSFIEKPTINRDQSLRAEILDILHEIPIEHHGSSKNSHLNVLADALISKLENISVQENKKETKRAKGEVAEDNAYLPKNLQPSEKELKGLVADAMIDLINKTNTIIKPDCIEEIEMDLTDILMDSISSLRVRENNSAKEEVANLLHSVIKLPVSEAIDFATQLTGHLKHKVSDKFESIIKNQQQTVMMFHNASKRNINIRNPSTTEPSSTDNNEQESDGYVNHCVKKLSKEIDEWLTNLQISQPDDKQFKHRVVHDLASDIIDRHKYLELNNSKCTDIDELEHLKYQIFKWINKLVGEDIMTTIDHAAELMQRIRKHLDPFFGGFHEHIKNYSSNVYRNNSQTVESTSKRTSNSKVINDITNCSICKHKESLVSQSPSNNAQTVLTLRSNQSYNKDPGRDAGFNSNQQPGPSRPDLKSTSINERPACQSVANTSKPLVSSLRPPCCSGPYVPGTPSMKQLNEEFSDFLTAWVQEIPIPANNPEEEAIAEKARIGIEHGIWKTIIKIKFHPEIFHNRFYYEDVLGEEVDELLDCLPQTQELLDRRHWLKAKLIEKTTEITDLIKAVASPASYKQQLAQQISGNLPRTRVKPEATDPKKQYEEMLIQCIAEDFILSTRYKEDDKVKAVAYKNKVIKRIEAFLDEVKKTHGKEIEDLDKELCVNDIFSALHKVPQPSEETIKEEADEILLGIEIDQWFTDLPVVKNDEQMEQLHRKRLKDALTKKLHEMEKELNVADCYAEPEFRHEISLFLDKIPLEKDEDLNMNFMVEELTNRMKNRERAGGRRRSVAFQDDHNQQQIKNAGQSRRQSQGRLLDGSAQGYNQAQPNQDDYQKFAMERPACSSMINPPPEPEEYANAQGFNYYEPSQKWYSWDSRGNPKESSMNALQEPQFVYAPGQFREENLGGDFGQTLHGGLRPSERYAYTDPVDSPNVQRPGPSLPRFFDSQANVIPHNTSAVPNQPNMDVGPPMNSQMIGMRRMSAGPQNFNAPVGGPMINEQANAIPPYPMPQNVQALPPERSMNRTTYNRFHEQRPISSSIIEPSGEFVSLLYDSKGIPPQYLSPQGSPMMQQPHFEPCAQPREQPVGGRLSMNQPPQNASQVGPGHISQRAMSPLRSNDIRKQPSSHEEVVKAQSVHQSRRGQTNMNASQGRLSLSRQDNVNTSNAARTPRVIVPEPELHNSAREARQVENEDVLADKFQKFGPLSCQSGAREAQSRSTPLPSSRSGVHTNEVLNRSGPPGTLPSSQDQRFLAPNPPPSGISISNQPGGFSTPNQRTSNAIPPNVKEKRLIDRGRQRRVETDTDDDEEEERVRCQCIERVRKCRRKRMGPSICDCDDCLGAFPYYFPMGCPYPYMFNSRRHCP
ncbi:uncharacterized protein isoform X1 [Choristoneura fumiferana]|uniref:uncharacterized protein isoform X1 n=2 Tax=Choristoneura fumiferana TaxID=7141 RepID=UPI003D15EA04